MTTTMSKKTEDFSADALEKYLNRYIKEIIVERPEIGAILAEFDIACVTCTVGTCLLKDVVEYHYLSNDRKAALIRRIAEAVSPDAPVKQVHGSGFTVQGSITEPPAAKTDTVPSPETTETTNLKYSPPVKRLVDEHSLIKRLLALIPEVIARADLESGRWRQTILGAIDFIRTYADRRHHAKEEEILFKLFDANLDILKVMHEDHTAGRDHVCAMLTAVENRDNAALAEHLDGYRRLLEEHIKKEDEILYPWMDRQFTDRQVGALSAEFDRADAAQGGDSALSKYEDFIAQIEKTLKGKR